MPVCAAVVAALTEAAFQPLTADAISEHIGPEIDWVVIGESSHGTEEFYDLRAEITKVLITKHGFNAVATEADFPDAFKVNKWVCGFDNDDSSPAEALDGFKRFPRWMWRNEVTSDFLQWLHDHNHAIPPDNRRQLLVGYYGMDIYSLSSSTHAVIEYLKKVDPSAAEMAQKRYSCFDKYGADAISYAFGLARGETSCETHALAQLVDVLKLAGQHQETCSTLAEEEMTFAMSSNARVVKEAEAYYRCMFFAEELTWNIRDKHMAETAGHLQDHLSRKGVGRPRIVLWSHNMHAGDGRQTDMGRTKGEVTLGQLLRERYGDERVSLVGMTTYQGSVSCATDWEGPCESLRLSPAHPDSYEANCHAVGLEQFGIDLKAAPKEGFLTTALQEPRLQRSIGALYDHTDESQHHYFRAWLRHQYDLLLYIDVTTANPPIAGDAIEDIAENDSPSGAPPTYPTGI